MQRYFSVLIRTSFLTLLLAFPLFAHALSVSDVLRVTDGQSVTRGEFIRATVKLLDIESQSDKKMPYLRVSRAMEPYVRAAHEKGALTLFRNDLLLARPIKRGEALQILVSLKDIESAIDVDFQDVVEGSDEEAAVKVVMEEGWMDPLSVRLFGVRRVLTGKDARLLLRKMLGEGQTVGRTQSSVIKVKFKSNKKIANLPKTQILESIWAIISEEFLYDENIDVDEAAYRAAEGIIDSLGDKYTSFFRPVRNRNFRTQLRGEVTGIGAQVEQIDSVLTIVTPIVGSPAEAAGLKSGDEILAVNGIQLKGLDFMEAVDKVRGPKGSTAELRIRRNGAELDVSVVRDVIKVPEVIATWQGNIAIIQLTQFGKLTQNELRPKLAEIKKKNPKGLILDIRNNPGGLLSAAGTVVASFVPRDTDVVEIHSRNSRRMDSTNLEPVMLDVPMVVLVNEGSASASEIVAGALQDHDRATIVGIKTFGKGTVQEVLQFDDQSGMKLTIAEWFTPLGRKIDGQGIMPDIIVENDDQRDDQMVKALDLLR